MATKFVCETQAEIHDMQQYLTGELFVFMDNLLTMESDNFKEENTFAEIQDVVS